MMHINIINILCSKTAKHLDATIMAYVFNNDVCVWETLLVNFVKRKFTLWLKTRVNA